MGLREISPLDGRYADKLEDLRDHVSEWTLMRRRVQVEVEWLLVLAPQLDPAPLHRLYEDFSDAEISQICASDGRSLGMSASSAQRRAARERSVA